MKQKEFKVGDKVYSLAHGWGEVIDIDNLEIYPIVVGFKNNDEENFTLDGRHREEYPVSLFHYEPEIIEPKWQPKEGEWCWFWDNHCPSKAIVSTFKESSGKGYMQIYGSVWDNCAPFVGELPEHLKSL